MNTPINYQNLSKDAGKLFSYLNRKLGYVLQFEIPEEIQDMLSEIQHLLHSGSITYVGVHENPHKHLFESYMDNLYDIQDYIEKIIFITGDGAEQLLALPHQDREDIAVEMDVPCIPDNFEGISNELQYVLKRMHSRVTRMEKKSTKYYLQDLDKFADYEEEIKKTISKKQ